MFFPDPNFFHPGSASKYLSLRKWLLSSRKYDVRVVHPVDPDPDPDFLPILDPRQIPDPDPQH
jgi:hypothetical protein